MDQRIGKVLMRIGFMDELFDMRECISDGRFLLKGPGKGKAVLLIDGEPPNEKEYFSVLPIFAGMAEFEMKNLPLY